ncbi:MAG: hypothetical protein ACPG4N_07450 [Gammaproteobacteria bacterium]
MTVVAIDIGFGFTKATNGIRSMVFKSIIGESTDIQYREAMLDAGGNNEHLHIEVDGHGYFVGELAERQSNVRSFTLDQNQFITGFAKNLALTALSNMVQSNAPVNLVTGLPISYFQRYKDELGQLLIGKHTVTKMNPKGEREEVVISVNKVRVVPQPFGSLFNVMLNQQGEMSELRYAREKIGVIDIGFRTADYTIADKIRYSERGSRTTEAGMARAFTVIANKLQESTGVNVEIYRLHESLDRGFIKIRGKRIDLKEMADQVFKQLAASIATEVDRLWQDDWDIDAIVITGGGGKALAPHLQPLLNGEVKAMDPGSDARLNNVQGYWRYGKHLWERTAQSAPPVGAQPPADAKPS